MKNLIDVMKYILSSVDYSIPVSNIVDDKVFVCSTNGITIGKIVKDTNGNEYQVTAFEFNESVTLVPITDPSTPFTGNLLVSNKPLFLHGSPSSTNDEYLKINQRTSKKTPFIWLLESYVYDDLGVDSSVDLKFDLRLFIMDWADASKWTNDDHNENVIKPMENIARMIKETIENDYNFKRLERFTIRPRSRFGVEITNKGSKGLIIHEDLSGVEVNFTLEVYETEQCKC